MRKKVIELVTNFHMSIKQVNKMLFNSIFNIGCKQCRNPSIDCKKLLYNLYKRRKNWQKAKKD